MYSVAYINCCYENHTTTWIDLHLFTSGQYNMIGTFLILARAIATDQYIANQYNEAWLENPIERDSM